MLLRINKKQNKPSVIRTFQEQLIAFIFANPKAKKYEIRNKDTKINLPNRSPMAGISIAYLPSLPLPKSNAGSSLIAHLIVNKYLNHLPFYRQVQMFKRDGVELAESTINNWFAKTADLLQPLYNRIWSHIREGDHIFADESTIQVFSMLNKLMSYF